MIAGVNVIAADSDADAQHQLVAVRRARAALMLTRPPRDLTNDEADALLQTPQGRHVEHMMQYTAAGTPRTVKEYLDAFAAHADADELIVVHASPGIEARLRSVDLVSEVAELV